jgi:hypothetical protein
VTLAERERIANELRNAAGLIGLAEAGVHKDRLEQAERHAWAAADAASAAAAWIREQRQAATG